VTAEPASLFILYLHLIVSSKERRAIYLTVVEEPSTPYIEMSPIVELFPDTREMPLKTMPVPFCRPIIIYVERDAPDPSAVRSGPYETQRKERESLVAIAGMERSASLWTRGPDKTYSSLLYGSLDFQTQVFSLNRSQL